MDPILTWIPLFKRLHRIHVNMGSIEPLQQLFPGEHRIHMEPLEQLYSSEYMIHMEPLEQLIPLFKRLHGSYTYLDSVAQEALWSLYSPGYRCSRGSMDVSR
jgi:hypothetical protein